ncbi:MAG: hypothetical protein A3J28_08245 [Acidobacteria bacterium RIFCSPLOWO2_12_FULL_60_22]|nr:MAG: hypothetical protein A3J28_08245 [Acidobacteria bacterium RIFCSPLOWO2_12_FULL_60_22]
MFTLLASALFIATVVLFFLPDLLRGPFHHFLVIGAILWFVISRWMKREWKRRVEHIADRFGDPYKRIREIGELRDFWQDYPRNLQRMDFFSQGDLGTAGMAFTACSFMWICLWLISF